MSEKKRLDAIRFIHAFEQLDKFPPMPLLKAHLKFAKKDAKTSFKKGQDPIKAQVLVLFLLPYQSSLDPDQIAIVYDFVSLIPLQDESIDKEVVSLRAIIRCIESYKLGVEPQYSPENLKKRISELKRQKKERKVSQESHGPEAQGEHPGGKKRVAPDVKAQPNKNSNKHRRTDPASSSRSVSFRAPATGHSIQPAYLRPVDLFESRGAEYYMPSAGMPRQAADAPHTSYGNTSTFNSLRASHHQQTGSYKGEGAEYAARYYDSAHSVPDAHNSLSAGRYGLVGSSPIAHTRHTTLTGGAYELTNSSPVTHSRHTTQRMNSTTASYGLGGSTSHLSPLTQRYGTSSSMAGNGRTGQFGSAGSPPPARVTNDRPVSSSGYGTHTNQYQPSIYHL